MNKRKWYAKTILDIPVGFVFLATLIYLAATYIKNTLRYGSANLVTVLIIGGCIILACLGSAAIVRALYRSQNHFRAGIIAVLALLLLVFAAWLIVEVKLPILGVSLRKPHIPFNWSEFLSKTINALFTISMATLAYAFYLFKITGDRVRHELEREAMIREKDLANARTNTLLYAMQSHYTKYVMSDIVAHTVMNNDKYAAEQIVHISKTFEYVADIAQGDSPVVSIHRALAYFYQVVDSIRLRRGGDSRIIRIRIDGEPSMQEIGALTLTTLLENSDTHGCVDADNPIDVYFSFQRGSLFFRCHNNKHPLSSRRETTGQGLDLVKQELAFLTRHQVLLEIDDNDTSYTVSLTIYYL